MSSIINTLFGSRKTPAERLRQHQRSLQKAQRELDRERTKLEQQEKKLVQEIRKNAKDGQMVSVQRIRPTEAVRSLLSPSSTAHSTKTRLYAPQAACKIQARDLVRTRRHIQKFYSMRTQLQAVSLRIQTMRSNQQMGEAMRGATRAMGMMNRGMNLPQIAKIMRDFERESEVMDMKGEMIDEAVDGAMEDEDGIGEEEEGDQILKEVLDSIGVDLSQSVSRRRPARTWTFADMCTLSLAFTARRSTYSLSQCSSSRAATACGHRRGDGNGGRQRACSILWSSTRPKLVWQRRSRIKWRRWWWWHERRGRFAGTPRLAEEMMSCRRDGDCMR